MNFFEHFFRGIAEYSNFKMFSLEHLIIFLIGIVGSLLILKKVNVNRQFERIIGVILLIQQITLYLWYVISGYEKLTESLPLYHCRVAIILLVIGFLFNQSIFKKIGSIWGLLGGLSALVYPSALEPFLFPHMTQFSFFIGHTVLLWGSVYCLCVERLKLNKKDLKTTLQFTNIYHVLMFILNHKIGSNYGFMRVSPIGIGNELHPILYGLIVILIFNIFILIVNALMNREERKSLRLVESANK